MFGRTHFVLKKPVNVVRKSVVESRQGSGFELLVDISTFNVQLESGSFDEILKEGCLYLKVFDFDLLNPDIEFHFAYFLIVLCGSFFG